MPDYHGMPRCDTFQPHPSIRSNYCSWCLGHVRDHEYIDGTRWSNAGPFLGPGQTEERIPNPRFNEETQ